MGVPLVVNQVIELLNDVPLSLIHLFYCLEFNIISMELQCSGPIFHLKEKEAGDIQVFGGGIIPDEDIPKLKEAGVKELFTPGASLEEIVTWVRENIQPTK